MTGDDWRALLEAYLADESDAETFKDEFIEAYKAAREDSARIPDIIEDLQFTVDGYDPAEDDTELRDEVQKALDTLNKSA